MALVIIDRAKETTTSTGTGPVTLLGAVTGFQSLAGIGNANTTFYCIADQTGANWEVGLGTYSTTGPSLARTQVLSSSNAGAAVTFTAGIKDVFVTYPSSRAVTGAPGLVENAQSITTSYTIPSGRSAMSSGPITLGSGVSVTIPSGSKWVIL
jgi:hypothetical protein